jgi:Rab GDP dissociation inhibitor
VRISQSQSGNKLFLHIFQLYERFKSGEEILKGKYGKERDYSVDIIPKFMMASGDLVEILVHTDVVRYLEFQQISGSYVFIKSKGLYKVPSSEGEAATSSLLGMFEKVKLVKFLHYVKSADPDDPSTWDGFDLKKMSMRQVYKYYGLDSNPQDMIGHALALHPDDSYVDQPADDTFRRIRLYMNSLARYGKSPYIYPMYGMGELPQGFARLSAIYGGTYMLDAKIDGFEYNEFGKIIGVKTGEGLVKCKKVVASPSYFPELVKQTSRVVRAICLLDHPIPGTNNADSCQIIIPQRQLNRNSGTLKYLSLDLYIVCLSSTHQVCAAGYYISIVSTVVETEDPHSEIKPGLDLLGNILEK